MPSIQKRRAVDAGAPHYGSSVVGYGLPDAAAAAGVSRSLLYAEMAAGRLASKKVGKRRIIPAAALHAWLAAQPDA